MLQNAHENRGMEPFYTCDVQSQNTPSCVMGGGCCCTVSRAAARRAEQGCQRIQGEEEEGESAQRHAGAIQHAASAASSCGYVQHAHIRLQRGRLLLVCPTQGQIEMVNMASFILLMCSFVV